MTDQFIHLRQAGLIQAAQPLPSKRRGPKLRPIPIAIANAITEWRKQKSLAIICEEFGVNRNTVAVYLYGDKHSKNRPIEDK
jgi:hypothetical protein